jgi:cell division protein FtsB
VRRAIRAALLGLALLVVVDAVVGEDGLLALVEARRTDAALRRALDEARATNEELRVRVRKLREQRSTIETVARQDLGLVKPGETLFIIKNAPGRR